MPMTSKLPPLDDLLEELTRASRREVGAKYGVSGGAVAAVIKRARQNGRLPPASTPNQPTNGPTRAATGDGAYVQLDNMPRSGNRPGIYARRELPPPAPDGATTCAARQVLGNRVCDLRPHPRHVGHVGSGDHDPRGEFWGQR